MCLCHTTAGAGDKEALTGSEKVEQVLNSVSVCVCLCVREAARIWSEKNPMYILETLVMLKVLNLDH